MTFDIGDEIEFTYHGRRRRGSVVKIQAEEVILNLFAAQDDFGNWRYMGVKNETLLNKKEIEKPLIVRS